ncbi:MAG: hypothetical protein IJB93_06890 [Clostridia bacterium]|nr:hypothetical protein [Clostridia bacterium]
MFDLTTLFIEVFNLSISAGWIVLAVVLLRFLLKKAPKWINCLWWLLVGIRLVFPFSIESIFSLIPSAKVVSPDIIYSPSPSISTGFPALNTVVNPVISESFAPDLSNSVNPLQVVAILGSYVWLIGIAVMVIYAVVCYVLLKRKMRTAVKFEGNIFESENVQSPFILGILKPKIYLPFGLTDENRNHIISHENAHLKRKDHLIKPVAYLILSVYWFNPLMWLSYVLLCRYIELACDEKAVKNFAHEERQEYSFALLQNSTHRRMIAACPLAFGEVGVKQRIKSVMNYKKPAFWVIVVALVASVVASVCLLTNPVSADEIKEGYYLERDRIYSERVTDYVTENIYGVDFAETPYLYVIENGITMDVGELQKSDLDNERLGSFTFLDMAPELDKITTAYVARNWDGESETENCTLHYLVKTENDEYYMIKAFAPTLWLDGVINEKGEAEIGEVGQITVKEIRRLGYLGENYKDHLVTTERTSEASERDSAIRVALMNQLPAPDGSLSDGLPFTTVSIHVPGVETVSGTRKEHEGTLSHIVYETYAVCFARYRYTYENGQFAEYGEANKAVLEFEIWEDGTYALKECKEFISDESAEEFEKRFNELTDSSDYDETQLADTLTYECRVNAMNHFDVASWTYSPMLSATWHYACPITFSMDYDKAVISCTDGTMVKEKNLERNEEATEMTYENGDTPIWTPIRWDGSESSEEAKSAEISFRLYKNGRTIYKGKITAKAQEKFVSPLGQMYIFEISEGGNKFLISEGPTVRLGVWTNEIRFFKERVAETNPERVIIANHYLSPAEIEKLNEIMDTAEWVNSEYIGRKELWLDGKFLLEDDPVFFSDESNVLYMYPYYTEISGEDMDFIMSLQGKREYTCEMGGLYSKLTLTLSSKFFEFSSHPLSSATYYGYYEETEDSIILKDDETEAVFTFIKSEGKLIFDEKNSSPLPEYNGVANLEDGAVFSQ